MLSSPRLPFTCTTGLSRFRNSSSFIAPSILWKYLGIAPTIVFFRNAVCIMSICIWLFWHRSMKP